MAVKDKTPTLEEIIEKIKLRWVFNKDNQTIMLAPIEKSTTTKKIPNDMKQVLLELDFQKKLFDMKPESRFVFTLTRYRDDHIYTESLKIECERYVLENGSTEYKLEANGAIMTSIDAVDKDIKQFMRFGVALPPQLYSELIQEIKNNYLWLESTPLENSEDSPEFLEIIHDVVEEYSKNEGYIVNNFVCVPVVEFNDMFADLEELNRAISSKNGIYYDLKALKRHLRDKQYIECKRGRIAVQERIMKKENSTRVLKFNKAKVDAAYKAAKDAKDAKDAKAEADGNEQAPADSKDKETVKA